jgi:hypothetical protein
MTRLAFGTPIPVRIIVNIRKDLNLALAMVTVGPSYK